MNGERTKHRRQQQRLIYCRGTPVNNARQAGHEGTGFGRHRTLQRPQDRSDLRRTNNESVSPVALDINSTRPNEKNAPKKKQAQKNKKRSKKNARPKQAMPWPSEPSRTISFLTYLHPRPYAERGYRWNSFVRCPLPSQAQPRHGSASSYETGFRRHRTNPWWRFGLGVPCDLNNFLEFDHRPARPRAADDRS